MWRRVAICFSFGILCLVQGWALPSTTPAQGRIDSSGGRATGLPDIPEACKTPRMRPEAPAEVPRNEGESQGLSAEAYESLGTFYGREGQFSCAIAAFQAALARNPDRHEIRYKLALSFLENHAPQRAADELRVVLGAEPDSFKAHNALGRALQDLGQFEQASDEFKKTLTINPRFALASYGLARLLSSQKKYQAAIYYLKDGLSHSPGPDLALEMKIALAESYAQAGDYADSIPLFGDAVAARPDSAELRFNLATAYAHNHDSAQAAKQYKETLRIDPHHNQAELSLAKALMNLSTDEAIRELRTATELKPDGPEARYKLGLMLRKKKEESAAKQQFEIFERLEQQTKQKMQAGSLNSQGNDLLEKGFSREAAAAYRKALLLEPKDARLHYNLALALSKLQEHSDEERQLRQAIELDPHFAQAQNQLGSSLMLRERFDEAEREFRAAIESDPQYAEALNNLGTSLGRQAKNSEAAQSFREAIAIS